MTISVNPMRERHEIERLLYLVELTRVEDNRSLRDLHLDAIRQYLTGQWSAAMLEERKQQVRWDKKRYEDGNTKTSSTKPEHSTVGCLFRSGH